MIRHDNGQSRSLGPIRPLHDTVSGRVSYSREEGEVAFVIDGRYLTLYEFAKVVEMYEGWQFRLEFVDEDEEVR